MATNIVIDLGTSHFRAGLANGNGFLNEPSTVAKDALGNFIIGEQAERMVGRHPENVELIHPINGGTIENYEATVAIFRHIARKLISQRFAPRFHLTLSIPSVITQVERKALEEAAREAGAGQVELFEGVVAAAVGAGMPIEQPTGCLLVSLGAGATEIALLSFGGIVHSRRLNIGGNTVDAEIIDWLRREQAFLIGQHTAEQLKQQIGTARGTVAVKGRNLRSGLPEQLQVADNIVRDSLDHYHETIVGLIVQTIESCPPELVGDIIDRGIILVGGGALDPNVLENLTQSTEVPIIVAEEPNTCVIRGLMGAVNSRNKGTSGAGTSGARKRMATASQSPGAGKRKSWLDRLSTGWRKTGD